MFDLPLENLSTASRVTAVFARSERRSRIPCTAQQVQAACGIALSRVVSYTIVVVSLIPINHRRPSMAKKKSTRKKTTDDLEMIHFRPGAELGSLIGQWAKKSNLSRGEVAKRLTSLAIRGLDVGFYDDAERLSGHLYGNGSFDEACHHLHVAVQIAADRSGKDVEEVSRSAKADAIKDVLNLHQSLREFEEEAQNTRVSIKLHRTNS